MDQIPSLLLFVPANRPERYAGALGSGADAVIIDLEDAVVPDTKSSARALMRDALRSAPPALIPLLVRINAVGTPWHNDDLETVNDLLPTGRLAGVMLPKAETAQDIRTLRDRLAQGATILALIETATGLDRAQEIARAADRIAFGSIDFAADIGCDHSREALLLARSHLAVSARAARKASPIDGITRSIHDENEIEADARYGANLGLKAKLLIHPAQIAPARRGLAPTERELVWAERILAGIGDGNALTIDGQMVDAPVIARARQIRDDHERTLNRQT